MRKNHLIDLHDQCFISLGYALKCGTRPYIHSLIFLDMESLYDTPYIQSVQNIQLRFLLIILKIVRLNPWNDLSHTHSHLNNFAIDRENGQSIL